MLVDKGDKDPYAPGEEAKKMNSVPKVSAYSGAVSFVTAELQKAYKGHRVVEDISVCCQLRNARGLNPVVFPLHGYKTIARDARHSMPMTDDIDLHSSHARAAVSAICTGTSIFVVASAFTT